jgi:hypothetical protein
MRRDLGTNSLDAQKYGEQVTQHHHLCALTARRVTSKQPAVISSRELQ